MQIGALIALLRAVTLPFLASISAVFESRLARSLRAAVAIRAPICLTQTSEFLSLMNPLLTQMSGESASVGRAKHLTITLSGSGHMKTSFVVRRSNPAQGPIHEEGLRSSTRTPKIFAGAEEQYCSRSDDGRGRPPAMWPRGFVPIRYERYVPFLAFGPHCIRADFNSI
jgi:hypothetical protein